jgi:dipeptidyl aminopeptidase/acylaminoacyl peptidase
MKATITALVFSIAVSAFAADPPPKFELTIDSIMRGHALTGWEPRALRWSADGSQLFFEWKDAADSLEKDWDTWRVNRDGTSLEKLTRDEAKNVPPADGSSTRDHKRLVYVDDGDVYLFDDQAHARRALTSTAATESHARITEDGRRVTFVRDNNLFLINLDDGSLTQLTNIGKDFGHLNAEGWPEKEKTKSQEFVATEERKLLDAVNRAEKKREEDEQLQHREHPRKPFPLEGSESVSDLMLTPDGKFVIALIEKKASDAKRTIVPRYVTESAYTDAPESRLKAGDPRSSTRIVAVDVTNGARHPLDVAFPRLPADSKEERGVFLSMPVFSDDGKRSVIPAASLDNKDAWLVQFDPATGKGQLVVTFHDDAWLSVPGNPVLGILPDGRIFFTSEKTGYAHLYEVPWGGGDWKAITSGDWEVIEVALSDDRKSFDLTTSEASPFEHHLYRVSVDGGERKRLTSEKGFHESHSSPDLRTFADIYSYTNVPPELYLQPIGGKRVKVTTSPLPEFFAYPWQDAPIVRVPARDGANVPARLYKPANPNGSAVIFVHGAGYLQNVALQWSYYFREFMFHHLLMQRGVTVIDLDYRGSAGYGRVWRSAIYRHMGGQDLDDQVDAAKWLAREHHIDPKRIGIYGGSYGGFITLMAMFTQPDVFAAGAALRPVTDWAHYNDEYTSNILNRPQDDAEAYRRSSPIYFAEGLKGALLICHGMGDTNVHFQDSVRLAQRLIELRKENWELAAFPVENHSFVEATSWADEYKRILHLFERNVIQ